MTNSQTPKEKATERFCERIQERVDMGIYSRESGKTRLDRDTLLHYVGEAIDIALKAQRDEIFNKIRELKNEGKECALCFGKIDEYEQFLSQSDKVFIGNTEIKDEGLKELAKLNTEAEKLANSDHDFIKCSRCKRRYFKGETVLLIDDKEACQCGTIFAPQEMKKQ